MARIVVLGSIARDDVIHLDQRLREGTHLQGSPPATRLGGGGANAAIALSHAGHEVSLVAAVGTDSLADELLAELSRYGVDVGPVTRLSGSSTHSLVLLDPEGERTIVNLTRARETRPPRRLLDLAADCVYVRSHGQDLEKLLRTKSALCPIIAQIQPLHEGRLPVQVLVGSHGDLDPDILSNPLAAGRALAGDTLRWVVITHGAEGAEAFSVHGERLRATAPDVDVVDTTGAGDAFAAGLAHALSLGMEMDHALPLAVRWGSAKVTRKGSFLDRDCVREILREWTARSSPNRP
ncbi:Carbohydrate kinase PfkB family [Paramagnetospirillum magnetotacticum MS-1]|uniref:Carbohydrate kinase PfkB family n=1 Tax=Paramagnetospirillum magnetotacticum MS-1 TaxID=272627 RepID=A0A0C2Z1G4_PARME|nr:carbohydrate kinase family protein [Paramagnetospirillum magnetotacticum]KIM00761.1 Carbohydrate kinase PfkB family [Paramagnetospirillum magnetotacticum MS-1]